MHFVKKHISLNNIIKHISQSLKYLGTGLQGIKPIPRLLHDLSPHTELFLRRIYHAFGFGYAQSTTPDKNKNHGHPDG